MRGLLAAVLLVVVVVAIATAGAAGASDELDSVDRLLGDIQQSLDRLDAVDTAAENTNLVRGAGGLTGLGLGIALGSVVTYLGWRR